MTAAIPSNVKEITLTRGYVAFVSPEDYEWLAYFRWTALTPNPGGVYAVRFTNINGKRTCFYMHREILRAPHGIHVDHHDGFGLHNWRSNLRLATCHQNGANSRPKSCNTSGFKGISAYGDCGRYRATIMVHGQRIHLGCRDRKEEAALLYDAAAIRYFGEFARTNFRFEPIPGVQL